MVIRNITRDFVHILPSINAAVPLSNGRKVWVLLLASSQGLLFQMWPQFMYSKGDAFIVMYIDGIYHITLQ